MPGLRTAPDESGLKSPSGGAVPSPAIHRRAGEENFPDTLLEQALWDTRHIWRQCPIVPGYGPLSADMRRICGYEPLSGDTRHIRRQWDVVRRYGPYPRIRAVVWRYAPYPQTMARCPQICAVSVDTARCPQICAVSVDTARFLRICAVVSRYGAALYTLSPCQPRRSRPTRSAAMP